MSVILKNNVEGFLATTISASDVSLVLQPGDGAAFPNPVSPDYFYATLVSTGGTVEVVRVTARVGDTMSILRGQDGTTANSFAAGSRLEMRVNAQSVIDTVYGITNYQGGSASNPTTRLDGSALQAGDFYFNTSAAEVRFYNGVAWQSLTTGSIDVQNFVGNGTQTTFTLSQAPTGEDNTQVYIKGVYQQKDTYSISGLSLIFSTAPPAGTTIEVVTIEAIAIGQTSSDLVSYQPAGVAAVPTTVREKLRETVSVKDFGVVCDGITDDTAALTAALNSGKSVYHPGGTILITTPITINSGLSPSLIGASANLCEIKASGTLAASYQNMITWDTATDFSIENITFNKNNTVAPTAKPLAYESCALLIKCENIKINNCVFKNFKEMGVIAQTPKQIWFTKNVFYNNYPTIHQNEGVFVTNDFGMAYDCYIDQNIFEGTGMDIRVEHFYVTNNIIRNFAFGAGITVESDPNPAKYGFIANNLIYDSGLVADENNSYCPGIESWSPYTIITGNQIYRCASAGISQGGQNCVVSNNICINNSKSINWPGIMLRHTGASGAKNANSTILVGNICTDDQITKTQNYGIQTESSNVERIALGANLLVGNKTAPENLTGNYVTHNVADVSGSTTVTPGTIANGASYSTAFTVIGCNVTDLCIASCSVNLQGMSISANISSANTATVIITNNTGTSKTLGACTLYAKAIKRLNFVNY